MFLLTCMSGLISFLVTSSGGQQPRRPSMSSITAPMRVSSMLHVSGPGCRQRMVQGAQGILTGPLPSQGLWTWTM